MSGFSAWFVDSDQRHIDVAGVLEDYTVWGQSVGSPGESGMPAPPDLTPPETTRITAALTARILRLERLVDYLFGWLQTWKDLF